MLAMNLKQIFCHHDWQENTKRVMTTKYNGVGTIWRICSKCHKYELDQEYGISGASIDGERVIRETLETLGRWDDYNSGRMGSWYYCEFRSKVSEILDDQGEYAARKYVCRIFGRY